MSLLVFKLEDTFLEYHADEYVEGVARRDLVFCEGHKDIPLVKALAEKFEYVYGAVPAFLKKNPDTVFPVEIIESITKHYIRVLNHFIVVEAVVCLV